MNHIQPHREQKKQGCKLYDNLNASIAPVNGDILLLMNDKLIPLQFTQDYFTHSCLQMTIYASLDMLAHEK